jgi:transcription antitermination protein NusB
VSPPDLPGHGGGRREARERALELAYEANQRRMSPADLVAGLPLAPAPFVVELLSAAENNCDRAEELIAARATGWSIERMPVLDRLIMRIAVAEMLTLDTPTGVVLAEAVDLAKRYSTDESGRFVNGVLAAVARQIRPAAQT